MIRESYARRRPLPESIQNAPDLFVGLELYFSAFIELNTCRQTGWSAGPIPTSSILEYCAWLDLDADETEDMFYLIRQMDHAFLKYIAKKNQESS